MGMPVSLTIEDAKVTEADFNKVFDYFRKIDARFSPYKTESEVTRMNSGLIREPDYSPEMREILKLSEETKRETDGYFDIYRNGVCNPSGLVKGWAIKNAADIVNKMGFKHYLIEAGGDIQSSSSRLDGSAWRIGIRNPFNQQEIIKVVYLRGQGIATSGTYERGPHIYNPKTGKPADEIASLTVIGPNVYEADRFSTPAFVMGEDGVKFIAGLKGFEAYQVNKDGIAVFSEGFKNHLQDPSASG